MSLELDIKKIISDKIKSLGREDLFREPLVSFAAADDKRFINLKSLIGPWHKTPQELLASAKSVICYFIPFTRKVISQPKICEHGSPLWSEAYQEINRHFLIINQAVGDYLKNLGYDFATIPPTHTYDPKDLQCYWSHRSAAVIAGLGSFGANRLVITDKGSGGRFCSLITSAALAANLNPAETRCLYLKNGSCGLCFKVCPVHALRPDGMEKFACQDEVNKNECLMKASSALESADTCGKCISVCPLAYLE